MKKINKILLIVSILLIMFMFFSISIYATYTPERFGQKIDTVAGTGKIRDVGGMIVGIIRVVGTIVSVGMIIVLGIKYMVGSAEERAEYKKTLFPYLIGAVLIFGASTLTQMIYNWAIEIS